LNAAGLVILEEEEDFLNFADYFANALKHKETSYTITNHADSAVTLDLNLYYDMGSYYPVGSIKMRLVQDNLDSSVLKMMEGLNNLYQEEKITSEEYRISNSVIQSPKAHSSDLGKRSSPEGYSLGPNNEGIKSEDVKIDIGNNTDDIQTNTTLRTDSSNKKMFNKRSKKVVGLF